MMGLLYKDWVCARLNIFMTAVFLLFPGVLAINFLCSENMVEAVMILALIVYGLMMLFLTAGPVEKTILQTEKSGKIEAYVRSLPVGRTCYVVSKFVLLIMVYIYVMVLILLALKFAAVITNNAMIANLTGDLMPCIPALAAVFIIISAIEMPFYFRFGIDAGENVKMVIIITAIFAIIVYALFGNMDVFRGISVQKIINHIGNNKNAAAAVKFGLPSAALVIYIMSCIVSVKLYRFKKPGE